MKIVIVLNSDKDYNVEIFVVIRKKHDNRRKNNE